MTLDEALHLFANVRPSGGAYSVRCPAHDDHRNSALVSAGERRWFIRCFAGCSEADILRSVGLSAGDVWYEPQRNGFSAGLTKSGIDPLTWLARYTGVEPDVIAALPVTDAPGSRLRFAFGPGLPSKLRPASTKDFTWEPAGAATPILWPLPLNPAPAELWLC